MIIAGIVLLILEGIEAVLTAQIDTAKAEVGMIAGIGTVAVPGIIVQTDLTREEALVMTVAEIGTDKMAGDILIGHHPAIIGNHPVGNTMAIGINMEVPHHIITTNRMLPKVKVIRTNRMLPKVKVIRTNRMLPKVKVIRTRANIIMLNNTTRDIAVKIIPTMIKITARIAMTSHQ
jgi:hypothetical protein